MNEEQAAVLAILLTKSPILSGAPDYIREKIEQVQRPGLPERILDEELRALFYEAGALNAASRLSILILTRRPVGTGKDLGSRL